MRRPRPTASRLPMRLSPPQSRRPTPSTCSRGLGMSRPPVSFAPSPSGQGRRASCLCRSEAPHRHGNYRHGQVTLACVPCVETPLTPAFPCFVLARADDCADDIKEFCSTTEVGENRLRDCLTKQQEAESKGNVDGKTLSEPCKVELKEFKVVESTNINLDVGMAGACKEDADKFCKDAANWDEPGPVIACLREVKEEIGEACLAHIFLQEKEVLPHAPPLCGCSPSSSCPCCRGGHVRHVVWGWQRSPCNQLRPRRCASAGCQGHGRGPRASRDVRGRRENPVPWHQARGGLGPGVPAREALPHHVGVRG
mmetsp:Transcript_65400/g.206681  ORF Transcript_65400/g.206681 Transcript_65400/m.206681 type:complete len:311 (-) Transcript_65400:2281-3213(-)